MSRTFKKITPKVEDSSFELDLSPMLALMVTLIPIMLLATVFVHVSIIETPLPQVVQKALQEDRNKKDREVLVEVQMNRSGFTLKTIQGGTVIKSLNIPKKAQNWDLAGLHQELIVIKQSHPKVFRLDLNPAQDVKYDEIVKVMDAARETVAEEPKFMLQDKETKEQVESNLMFPDVIFANVVEG